MHLKDLHFIDAVKWLSGNFINSHLTNVHNDADPLNKRFSLPTKNKANLSKVITYLINHRSIPIEIVIT